MSDAHLSAEGAMIEDGFASQVFSLRRTGNERRLAVRHLTNPETACQLLNPVGTPPYPAWVRDISHTGLSLLLEQRFVADTILAIELDNAEQEYQCRLLARVVYTIEFPNGDWLHGCTFARELTDAELSLFI